MDDNDKKIAVLIDVENISAKFIDKILDEVSLFGTPTYKRLYGDFTRDDLKAWNDITNEYSLKQMQQGRFTTRKNSSDSVLIIDAMDILYSNMVDGFCIVSSDSDFTGLAMRLVESGLDVIGMGENEDKAPKSFVNACTKFVYLDDSKKKTKKTTTTQKQTREKTINAPKKVINTIKTAIENSDTDDDGWTNVGPIGSVLYRRFPEFDPTRYGSKSKQLSAFLKLLDDFEVEERSSKENGKTKSVGVYIRIKK